MNEGDKVRHKVHGDGEIVRVSSSGSYVIVKYPTKGRFYYRTHWIENLEKL
jgi:hypothetical protein